MTNERLCIFLVFSNLIASKLLSSNRRMHNFIEKFTKINDICKKFAGNRVNEHGNVSRRGVIPTFSDLEVIALSLTAEAFGYDSENNLFKRLAESPEHIPNLISRRQFNVRRKLTACLAEDIPQGYCQEHRRWGKCLCDRLQACQSMPAGTSQALRYGK